MDLGLDQTSMVYCPMNYYIVPSFSFFFDFWFSMEYQFNRNSLEVFKFRRRFSILFPGTRRNNRMKLHADAFAKTMPQSVATAAAPPRNDGRRKISPVSLEPVNLNLIERSLLNDRAGTKRGNYGSMNIYGNSCTV